MVFLNLPETREERLRREVRAEMLIEARQEEEKRRDEVIREVRQEEERRRTEALREVRQEEERRRDETEIRHREDTAAANARYAAWYARMKEAQDKDEPFDEPPPWE